MKSVNFLNIAFRILFSGPFENAKKGIRSLLIFGLIFISFNSNAQTEEPGSQSKWSQNLSLNFYIYKNDLFTVPVYEADKDHLHLEAHYNYEAMNTFSAWYGYNFKGGKKLSYTITPMAGVLVGQINGIAPGLELTFNYKKFQFSSDSEYVFDLEDQEMNYLYVWSELVYSPKDWFWFGVSYQRTRIRDENIEFQGGGFVGGGYKWFSLTGYVYFGQNNPFGLITLAINYPDN